MYVFFDVADVKVSGLQNAEVDIRGEKSTINLASTLPASIETNYSSHTNGSSQARWRSYLSRKNRQRLS